MNYNTKEIKEYQIINKQLNIITKIKKNIQYNNIVKKNLVVY